MRNQLDGVNPKSDGERKEIINVMVYDKMKCIAY